MKRARIFAGIVGVGSLVAALGAIAAEQVRHEVVSGPFLANASFNIPCSSTPFGNAVPVVRDFEAMLLLWGSGGDFFDEYTTSVGPPLQRVYRAPLASNGQLRKAIAADINGDGRDEIVELFDGGGQLRIAVYERATPLTPTAQIIDTWSFTEPSVAGSLSIVAGDFDGSKDRHQEVAVSWKIGGAGADAGKVRVVVLQGDGLAHIVQEPDIAAGVFTTTATTLVSPRLVAGNFLAAGRDQLALLGYEQSSGNMTVDLLEFDNGTHAASVITALPAIGNSMRTAHYSAGSLAVAGKFYFDFPPAADIQTSGGFPVIEGLEANGGDMVDTAADELAFHVMFFDPVAAKHVLAQRILHFDTARSGNTITTITLNAVGSYEPNTHSNSSIKLGAYPDPAPKFAATVADVDALADEEIVTAIAGHDGDHGPTLGPMVWFATKVHVRNLPDFTWKNLGANASFQPVVAFTNTSPGDSSSYEWDFGDNNGTSPDKNPRHAYATNGLYNVTLTTTDAHNGQVTVGTPQQIQVTGATDALPHHVGSTPPYAYVIDDTAAYSGTSAPDYVSYATHAGDNTIVKIAVGDMDKNALPEVVVAVDADGTAVDLHVFKRQSDLDNPFLRSSLHNALDSGNTSMELVFSDFDGDSLNAVLSNVAGACRNLSDESVTSVTWMPPYFIVPQVNSSRFANYGKSSHTSSSTENHSESFFSNSFTVSVGYDYELDAPVAAVKLAETQFKVNVGAEYQFANGETHGQETEYALNEGYSIGNDSGSNQESLLVVESNNSNCYSYDLVTSAGKVPGSMMRSCSPIKAVKQIFGTGARDWNELGTDGVPFNWVPMQRDWASLALFHVPQGGSAPATPISFGSNPASNATDGRFDTAAESTSAVDNPYLDIDLGYVREIDSIRVFPSADGAPTANQPLDFKNAVLDLQGFRLYAWTQPFSGSALPTNDDFTNFNPDGISTFIQDAGAEAVYRSWNVWTSNNGDPLRARYLRLQKPTNGQTNGKIRIAEIQVFGDTHSEPQFYPEAVCDPVAHDGLFVAYVYDNVNRVYKSIHVRGDMVWTGTVDLSSNYTGVEKSVQGVTTACLNDTAHGIRQGPIWQLNVIAGSATSAWNFSEDQTQTDSYSHSDEWSGHIGAEFEATFGVGVQVLVGAEYEFTGGVTTENQSGRSTGAGFELGGEIGGFSTTYAAKCAYHPRPYNFTVKEYSDAGYLQNMSVTDYVVRQKFFGPPAWQRDAVPALCSDNSSDDSIFADGFGGDL